MMYLFVDDDGVKAHRLLPVYDNNHDNATIYYN